MRPFKPILNLVPWLLILLWMCSCSQQTEIPPKETVAVNDSVWVFESVSSTFSQYTTTCAYTNAEITFSGKVATKDSVGYMSFRNTCNPITENKLVSSNATGNMDFETMGDNVATLNQYNYQSYEHTRLYVLRLIGYTGRAQTYDLSYTADRKRMMWTYKERTNTKTIIWKLKYA